MSRRHAEAAIAAGRVKVNGQVISAQGQLVEGADVVTVDGLALPDRTARTVVILHKPFGTVTTRSDPEGRPTVMDLLPDELKHLKPVGRLDYATEGLLVLTDDGDLALKLTHPRYETWKWYWAWTESEIATADLKRLTTRISLTDGPGKFERARFVRRDSRMFVYEVVASEGRNRFVRRMFEALRHPARRLKRVRVGHFTLDDLKPGQYRVLTEKELNNTLRYVTETKQVLWNPRANKSS